MDKNQSYIYEQVRKYDNDRFLCGLFLEEKYRRRVFALLAFNIEIATISETTSEVMTGLIRLEWWRESINQLYKGHVRNHPVLNELSLIKEECPLSKKYFDEILEAREFDLYGESPVNIKNLLEYIEKSSVSLYYLCLESLEVDDKNAKDMARHMGLSWGLVGIMRAAAFAKLTNKPVMIPQNQLNKTTAVEAIYKEACLHNNKIKIRDIPKHARAIFYTKRMSENYLYKIRKLDFDILSKSITSSKLVMQGKLLYDSVLFLFR